MRHVSHITEMYLLLLLFSKYTVCDGGHSESEESEQHTVVILHIHTPLMPFLFLTLSYSELSCDTG